MARPHIESVRAVDVPLEAIHEGPLAGCAQRLLSSDDETGASTALVSLAGGWTGSLARLDRPVELFCVRGRLELDGRPFGEGCHGWVPAGTATAPLVALEASLCLAMLEEARPPTGGPVEIVDSTALPFRDRTLPEVPPGLIVKPLRIDPETGDRTWLAGVAPGWEERRAEIHPTVEEAFVLRGDGLLGTRGEIAAGSYFWRPPDVRHGPMVTRGGQLVFFRTKGGGIDVTYEDVPGWEQLVRAYLAKRPFADGL